MSLDTALKNRLHQELFFLRLRFLISRWDFDNGPFTHSNAEEKSIQDAFTRFAATCKDLHDLGLPKDDPDRKEGDKLVKLSSEDMKYLALSSVFELTLHAQ